jgi:hypothetical protein
MGAPILDNEFMQYWSKLTVVQKESLLMVAKNFVQSEHATDSETDLRKKMILEDRKNYLENNSPSFTWEQIKEMAVNKDKRHGLQN